MTSAFSDPPRSVCAAGRSVRQEGEPSMSSCQRAIAPNALPNPRSVRGWLVFCLVAFPLLLESPSPSVAQPSTISLDNIAESVSRRLQKVQTIHAIYSTKRVVRRGSLSARYEELRQPKPWEVCPPEDTVMLGRHELTTDGNSWRLDSKSMTWSYVANGTEEIDVSKVFHDGVGKQLFRSERLGSIEQRNELARALDVQSLFASFLTFESLFPDVASADLAILRQEPEEGGRNLVVVGNMDYNNPTRGGATRYEDSFDPSRGLIPTRLRCLLPSGKPYYEVQIEYLPHPLVEYAPASATNNLMNSETGEIEESCTLRVEKIEFGEPVAPAVFDLQFPAGTHVGDEISNLDYVVGEVPDGEKWVKAIAVQELMPQSPAAMRTPVPLREQSADAPLDSPGTDSEYRRLPHAVRWPWLIGLVVGLGCLVVLARSRVRKVPKP